MLRKEFFTVVAVARCGNPAVMRAEPCGIARTAGARPLRIAEPDTRCPRIELRAAGAFLICKIERLFCAVRCDKLDRAGTPRLRIALPDTGCPRIELRAAGLRFASKTNTQMSSRSVLKRLYYKAFAEAKPACLSQHPLGGFL